MHHNEWIFIMIMNSWQWSYKSQIINGSDNGLSPGRRQAIIWTNAEILLIGSLGTNVSEMLIEIYIFSFKKMYLKLLVANRRPFCLGLNVLSSTFTSVMISERLIIWTLGSAQSHNSLIFIMGIPTPGKRVFILKWHLGGCLNIKMSSYQYREGSPC